MTKQTRTQTTLEKALDINADPNYYGTFAEIGAGQETVRHFFRAGGSSGTIAKAMSAYQELAYEFDSSGSHILLND